MNEKREKLGSAGHTPVHEGEQVHQGYHWQESQVDFAPEFGFLCCCNGGCDTVFRLLFAAVQFLRLRRGFGIKFPLTGS